MPMMLVWSVIVAAGPLMQQKVTRKAASHRGRARTECRRRISASRSTEVNHRDLGVGQTRMETDFTGENRAKRGKTPERRRKMRKISSQATIASWQRQCRAATPAPEAATTDGHGASSTATCRFDCCDINLAHLHHRVEDTLGSSA